MINFSFAFVCTKLFCKFLLVLHTPSLLCCLSCCLLLFYIGSDLHQGCRFPLNYISSLWINNCHHITVSIGQLSNLIFISELSMLFIPLRFLKSAIFDTFDFVILEYVLLVSCVTWVVDCWHFILGIIDNLLSDYNIADNRKLKFIIFIVIDKLIIYTVYSYEQHDLSITL